MAAGQLIAQAHDDLPSSIIETERDSLSFLSRCEIADSTSENTPLISHSALSIEDCFVIDDFEHDTSKKWKTGGKTWWPGKDIEILDTEEQSDGEKSYGQSQDGEEATSDHPSTISQPHKATGEGGTKDTTLVTQESRSISTRFEESSDQVHLSNLQSRSAYEDSFLDFDVDFSQDFENRDDYDIDRFDEGNDNETASVKIFREALSPSLPDLEPDFDANDTSLLPRGGKHITNQFSQYNPSINQPHIQSGSDHGDEFPPLELPA